MPELPEVEILVRHLGPLLKGKTIHGVQVLRAKAVRPSSPNRFKRALMGASFIDLSRRGKYLVFHLRDHGSANRLTLVGHLGMTGRMYVQADGAALPKHAAVVMDLGRWNWVYDDPRYFGRLTLDASPLEQLGPEPLGAEFTPAYLRRALSRSAQPIKLKLLDQELVAGVGNIYASEALFLAGVSPRRPARDLNPTEIRRLWRGIRQVLRHAIQFGSTVPLNLSGAGGRDRLFYYGRLAEASDYYVERLRVYDREGKPCSRCGTRVKRIVQAARSTYYCPSCQPASLQRWPRGRCGRNSP